MKIELRLKEEPEWGPWRLMASPSAFGPRDRVTHYSAVETLLAQNPGMTLVFRFHDGSKVQYRRKTDV